MIMSNTKHTNTYSEYSLNDDMIAGKEEEINCNSLLTITFKMCERTTLLVFSNYIVSKEEEH